MQLPRQRRHTRRMAVPKESTFPPILQTYSPGLKATGRSPKPLSQHKATTPGIRFLLEEEKAKKRGVKEKERAVLPLKDERELELKRKRAKKAEITLKNWDALLQEERNDKHATLQQRIRLQKQLISKNDHLTDLQRTKAEEKKQERIRSRKEAHRQTVETLRAHIHKVEEHKRRIAEKLKEMENVHEEEDELGFDVSQEREDQSVEGTPCRQSTPSLESTVCDVMPSVETAWNEWKADTVRKLRPIMTYSQQLKNHASPSTRHCLSVYENPTVYDRFTGKAVPLTQVLSSMAQLKPEDLLSHQRGVMQQSAIRNQTRANIMLARKDHTGMFPKQDPGSYMYIEDCKDTLRFTPRAKQDILEHKCLIDISPKARRKLPRFLTHSGSLVATSLEEVGEKVYYRQSKTSRTHGSESVFLTDLQFEDESPIPSKRILSQNRPSWQPLSYTALSEHKGTAELPVCSGVGHLSHGRYKMWKPMQTVCS